MPSRQRAASPAVVGVQLACGHTYWAMRPGTSADQVARRRWTCDPDFDGCGARDMAVVAVLFTASEAELQAMDEARDENGLCGVGYEDPVGFLATLRGGAAPGPTVARETVLVGAGTSPGTGPDDGSLHE